MNDAVNKLAKDSGNAFHCRAANAFRDRSWATMLSPYYIDGSTDKAREIDLLVEKVFPVGGRLRRSIRVRLHIECKYIAQNVVFWFDAKDADRAENWISANTPFTRNNTFIESHHHINGITDVAKLFASDGKRAEDNDPIFRAVNQCLNGYIHNRGGDDLISRHEREETHVLEYPVILCSNFDTFYKTDVSSDRDPVPLKGNFLLELNYAFIDSNSRSRREYFLVDVVEFASLDTFLKAIQTEVEGAESLVGD